MGDETWQQLLALESVDVVRRWHSCVHSRELNARRTSEIASSAKQAREYFRNAAGADNTVRPLLTFYGVASLSRSLLLLLRRGSGEEALARGHGLEAVRWSNTLSGDVSTALLTLGKLKIRTSLGLFNDFVRETENRICLHVRSSVVDWRLAYPQPQPGEELTLEALMSRVPDLSGELAHSLPGTRYAYVNEMSYNQADGFRAQLNAKQFASFQSAYASSGYEVLQQGEYFQLRCSSATFQRCVPQFMHTYVRKTFGSIPSLHIVDPLRPDVRFSQLAITYMLSYILGMIARYFPTHWVALHSGAKGDVLWPAIHAIQKYVELSFPELVIELIHDALEQRRRFVEPSSGPNDAQPHDVPDCQQPASPPVGGR